MFVSFVSRVSLNAYIQFSPSSSINLVKSDSRVLSPLTLMLMILTSFILLRLAQRRLGRGGDWRRVCLVALRPDSSSACSYFPYIRLLIRIQRVECFNANLRYCAAISFLHCLAATHHFPHRISYHLDTKSECRNHGFHRARAHESSCK